MSRTAPRAPFAAAFAAPFATRLATRLAGRVAALAVIALTLAGCASLPTEVVRTESFARPPVHTSPIVRLANSAALPHGKTGVWPMPGAGFALDARVALIRNAVSTLDLQYYLLGNDEVGHTILRELRLAAERGVRVRLLVDDMHTPGLDPLLAGLHATPNAQVRLFNPFPSGRDSQGARYLGLLFDFSRLNHRMHNKAFIADGAMAVIGGRNLADEYFFRSREGNFIDIDFVVAGEVTSQLGRLFDEYWNSEEAYPVDAVVRPDSAPAELRQAFVRATTPATPPAETKPAARDMLGQPTLTAVLAGTAPLSMHVADASAWADSPQKARGSAAKQKQRESVTVKFVQALRTAQKEVLVFNPYFIPGSRGMASIRQLRERGIDIHIVTNSMSTSDEPIVNLAYRRYRDELLSLGVRIFELTDDGLKREARFADVLGESKGQLHAKLALVDRHTVMAGSMNLDARSAFANTEIGVVMKSPDLAARILPLMQLDRFPGVYEVRRSAEGGKLEWVSRDGSEERKRDTDPDGNWYQRFKVMIQSLFIHEDIL
ncbi:phospholipase D family protein [Ramlibacter sp.]|uniref:phospholipase D family protein n=1 Tax=Ramlibacter sp. TaxID=1917967 RepID=UPI003D1471F9